MTDGEAHEGWTLLPGPKWETPLAAKSWLIEQRRQLGWTHKDVEKAFWNCAIKSDLYTGPGGGDLFERATEKRVARFEREGQQIPKWMLWMPLAIEHSKHSGYAQLDWERQNIPFNKDVRCEEEDAAYQASMFELDDNEIELISRFREMNTDEQAAIRFIAKPEVLKWVAANMTKAMKSDETLEKALAQASS